MYQYIHEPIAVCVQFERNKVTPLSFTWGTRTYEGLQTNLVFCAHQGSKRLTYVSVDDGVNYFKLMLNNETLEWWLEETD